MIEIVIKIEEETYNRIMNGWMPLHKAANLMENVQKGTPLPKGHGRIADIDKLLEEMRATRTYDIPFALERVKPIIEADKEGENEANN